MRAAFAAALSCLVASGCTGTQVRLVEKSMEPTVRSGEFVEFDEWAYDEDTHPRRGDIVSFMPPEGEELSCNVVPAEGEPCSAPAVIGEGTSLVKRVIAVGGDTVAFTAEGRSIVNGDEEEEPFIIPCKPVDECELAQPIEVPPSHYFMVGDNRPYSGDSRDFGPIPEDAIEGKVTPPDR